MSLKGTDKEGVPDSKTEQKKRLANHPAILIVTNKPSSDSEIENFFFLNFHKILFFTVKRLFPKIHVI